MKYSSDQIESAASALAAGMHEALYDGTPSEEERLVRDYVYIAALFLLQSPWSLQRLKRMVELAAPIPLQTQVIDGEAVEILDSDLIRQRWQADEHGTRAIIEAAGLRAD